MNSQSYYRYANTPDCNERVTNQYLLVNCTGLCVLPEPFTSHSRDGRNDYYFLYLWKGMLNILVDGAMRPMLPGQVIVISPRQEYRYQMLGKEEVRYYWIHFTGFGAAATLEKCAIPCGKLLEIGNREEIAQEIQQMFTDFIHRETWYQVAAVSSLLKIFTIVSQGLTDGKQRGRRADRILTSLQYLHYHYMEPIKIAELAAMEHLSVSRYRTVFLERTGLSPQAFLIALRLQRACELMLGTDLSLKQIAQMAGYSDSLYFSRIFKERFGISPNRYRNGMHR